MPKKGKSINHYNFMTSFKSSKHVTRLIQENASYFICTEDLAKPGNGDYIWIAKILGKMFSFQFIVGGGVK